MRLSIVIAVYQSYEIVRRQLLHLKRILPPECEVLIVDDGSDPPIPGVALRTNNKLAWTQGLARNAGAAVARGEILFCTDIDHAISEGAVRDVLAYDWSQGGKMIFRRQAAVLGDSGEILQDRESLLAWGYDWAKGLDCSVHGNTWAMPRKVFLDLGGYSRRSCMRGYHPASRQGEDCHFNGKWNRAIGGPTVTGSDIYLIPTGRFHSKGDLNPHGLFHNLSQTKQTMFFKGEECRA